MGILYYIRFIFFKNIFHSLYSFYPWKYYNSDNVKKYKHIIYKYTMYFIWNKIVKITKHTIPTIRKMIIPIDGIYFL